MIVFFIFYGTIEVALTFNNIPTLLVRAEKFVSTQQRPNWFWDPHSLLCNGYRRFSLRGYSGRGVKLTTSIYHRGQEWWSYNSTTPYVLMAWCLIN
jgi:hypothetical protein